MRYIFATAAICLSLLTGFCVYAGTHWSDARNSVRKEATRELRADLENEGFEKLGYKKLVIGESGYTTYTIFVKRNY